MKKIDIEKLSKRYDVRKLHLDDVEMIYSFCKRNTQYYEYCGKDLTTELIERDLEITPPGIPLEQKYYLGFFENSKLVAVMDLEDGYPNSDYVYIGFFMMDCELQGLGIGSKIIEDALEYLRGQGFEKCQLGIDKDNPQSNHFWRKNGFEVIREVEIEEGIILVAEKYMSEIKLIEPTIEYAEDIWQFRHEIMDSSDNDKFAGCGTLEQSSSASEWIETTKLRSSTDTCPKDKVPSNVYIAVRLTDNKIVGIIDLRHHINHPILSTWGGHIGYYVRPTERGKGYGKEMLRQNLKNAQNRGIKKVLITCSMDNTASEKTILANGGVFDSTITVDDEVMKRYWITVDRELLRKELQCKIYPLNTLSTYKYTVICSYYGGKWVLSKHKKRDTYETQGGHIEAGETPIEAAKRELYEESGIKDATLYPVCDYLGYNHISSSNGQVFLAIVHSLDELPESEMEKIGLFEELPENLTYPKVSPMLCEEAYKVYVSLSNGDGVFGL
ncbi:MAG: GNAT family N-acetyltransferase [Agathobacter sp.]|nr:GNAT family N-acetyltransferase [Agathobacter sp.]